MLALPRKSKGQDVKKYKALVRVRKASSTSYGSVWAVVDARSAADARALLEAQYGRGNVGVVAEMQ